MDKALMWIMAICALIGGMDRILGNRLHLGEQFERGFMLMGPTALSMAGIICLVPLLSKLIRGSLVRICAPLGMDPAIFGGLLAIDMGGYQLAVELAADSRVGVFSGIVIAAILGCTITFTIPVGMGMLDGEARSDFARGILFGLISIPVALLAGGLLCGMELSQVLRQSLPCLLLSALVLLGMWRKTTLMIRGFSLFARLIEIVSTLGLMLAAFEYMTGRALLPGLAPIEDAMAVVASIAVVMLGSLPFAQLLQRALRWPLQLLGEKTRMNSASVAALLIGMVSVLPAIALVKDMDRRGRIVNAAFMVCAASAFAAHLGFVAGVDARWISTLLCSKLVGGAVGVAIALFATRRMNG